MQTKLFKPTLRPSRITRPHLINRLNDGLGLGGQGFAARLTLVSAPAGFGKTTLIADWLAQLTIDHCAWLSLDEDDNDPVRFLSYLISALQTAVSGIGKTAVRALQSPQPAAAESVLTLLINELTQNDQPIILVLDDYHVITTPAVHQALTFLLEHLPQLLHLLIATRSDPSLSLSRLRARQQMMEIRADDLRFSFDEATAFFNQVMGLALSNQETAALEQRTEGWIAGLQLVALSLKDRADRAELIAAFTGSHRYIIDYLTEEVLSHQPESVRDFLLATSILERLCGPLADAVTQSTSGQETLEYLEQSNLFLVPLDDERRWYRYHQLFADVLRQRLQHAQPQVLLELHRRASEWLEQNESTHEAVNHALAGRDYEQAARLIERVHGAKWQSGEIKTLQGWLAALPVTSWRAHPRLWLVEAWAAMTVGDFAEADEKLRGAEEALALLDEEVARTLRPEIMAFRASYASLVQDPRAVELAQQALQYLPKDFWLRGMLVVFLGAAYYGLGELDAALNALAQAPSSTLAASGPQPHQVHILAFGGMVLYAKGRLRAAWSSIRQALELTEPEGKPILYVGTLLAYMSASLVLYELGQLDQAEVYLTRCEVQAVRFGSAEAQAFALSGLARLCLARDDLTGAANYTERIDVLLHAHTFTSSIMAYVDYHRFQLLIKQGNLTAAAAWAESQAGRPASLNPYALHRVALPQLLLVQGRFEATLDELAILVQEAEDTGHGSVLIKALVLQALAFHACDNNSQASITLERALTLAEPEGFVRSFVDEGEPLQALLADYRRKLLAQPGTARDDSSYRMLAYVNKLLAAFPLPTALATRPPEPYLEPLSERELEVLRLIAAGASNRDIADALVLAVPTVKKHVSNILGKLNATSRTQAVAEARELGLLL